MKVRIPYLYRRGEYCVAETDAKKVVDLSKEDQIFSFRNRDLDRVFHWNASELHRLILANPQAYHLLEVGLDEQQAKHVYEHNGIEQDHLERIIDRGLIDTPGILLWWQDHSQTIMDGNHRFVLRFLERKGAMNFWVVTVAQARMCQLRMPPELDYKSGWN